jgi:hypothetical protein
MSITFTKKTITVYTQGHPLPNTAEFNALQAILKPQTDQLVADNKTDGVWDSLNSNTTSRLWVDEASALLWVSIMQNAAQEIGRTDVTVTIEDI